MSHSAHLPADRTGERPRLRIALVNNMPDGAMQTSERQFASLLEAAAGGRFTVDLSLYALGSVERGEVARAAMRDRYASLEALKALGTDGLIVTGAEPKTARLQDEPYWDELGDLVDWARTGTVSAIWSCLAAHAAVLRTDGIERTPLETKRSGVFTFETVAEDRLVAGLPPLIRMPHSRLNDLGTEALTAAGYKIVTCSPKAGADIFVRRGQSLFVHFQGHPEYESDTLMREYCRDVSRFLRGESEVYPQSPHGYFDAATERSYRALAVQARAHRSPRLIAAATEIAEAARPARPWRDQAVQLFGNWLDLIAEAKAERSPESMPA